MNYILILTVLIGSLGFTSIPASAAGWPSYARNVNLDCSFTETGTQNDLYSLMDGCYMDIFRFQVPDNGTITLTFKGKTDSVPCFHIYRTNNTENSAWFGWSGNRKSYDYDWNTGGYWSKWTISLKKGSYYLMTLHNSGTMNVKFTYKLGFKPSFSNSAVTRAAAQKKAMKVTWKKASRATGYNIQYSLYSNMKKAKAVTVSRASTTSRVIKGLRSGKTYYVRVRSYKKVKVGGKTKTYYGKWSSVKKVKIR